MGAVTTLAPEDRQAIEALHHRWVRLELAGQASAVLDLCDDQVVWLPPGSRPLRGREAILHWLSGPPATVLALDVSRVDIEGRGDTAWRTCEFVTTLKPSPDQAPITVLGAQLWVLARTAAGWRIVVASWTQR
jgi:uncharacterized protein (TIGR02246 family)